MAIERNNGISREAVNPDTPRTWRNGRKRGEGEHCIN